MACHKAENLQQQSIKKNIDHSLEIIEFLKNLRKILDYFLRRRGLVDKTAAFAAQGCRFISSV